MLTKSLHTITAVTNVAKREQLLQPSVSAETLAKIALSILGYDDIDTTVKGDPTVDRIVENCKALVNASAIAKAA